VPLDKHIADFLAASSGAPQPASLGDLRAATEVDLLRLQGEDELSDDMQDYVVIADDGYAIALRAYTPAASNAEIAACNTICSRRWMVSGVAVAL
jgi:acetyl esterase